jgi:hypothetical protein
MLIHPDISTSVHVEIEKGGKKEDRGEGGEV